MCRSPETRLTHVALSVRDPERSYAFYRAVVGMEAVYTQPDFIQAQTPGTRDVLVSERAPEQAGKKGGVVHFGFRLIQPAAQRCLAYAQVLRDLGNASIASSA